MDLTADPTNRWIRGRRLALDPGSVRIGVAVCDPDGLVATPVATVARDRRGEAHLDQIAQIATQYDVVAIIVGRPVGLSGNAGPAVAAADELAEAIGKRVAPIPIVRHDERFTTVAATQALRAAGLNSKAQRSVIDQAAAVAILQSWLDQHARKQQTPTEDGRLRNEQPETSTDWRR